MAKATAPGGAEMLREYLDPVIEGQLEPRPQQGPGSYYGRLDDQAIIDWRQKAEAVRNLIRVRAKPYNPTETLLLSRYLFVNKASFYEGNAHQVQRPGRIVEILDGDRLVVSCADGFLVLDEYDIYPQ